MCRFVAFAGKGEIDGEVIGALMKSSRKDVLSSNSHPDGWGYAIYVLDGEWSRFQYASARPMYADENVSILYTIRGERIVGIIHARKTLKRFLTGVSHAHPYHIRAGPYDLFFAHNGSVSRSAFKDSDLPYTDSYMILREIAKEVSSMDPATAYLRVMSRLKGNATSLNSALLSYAEGTGPELFAYYYYNRNNMREMEEYYKMYSHDSYVYSATVNYYLGGRGKELPLDRVYRIN
ncbi:MULTISPECIES: class II glutamine amidotransferase [Metallosphaera]|uniref:Glutamine amidotransferase-like protein n=3 Tax=Metallosphaera TaxID=41980 RepID=A4YD62_METS5|nr:MULTISPECIES: class II glutamine amidotransferase [Metallosphaera]ABP94364.1 glutamine amidotransferase-like protein [Metallosphaera sedula DSM 5348]AIM26351.1 glutamine amidotransferase-like protein [Metallosphaera sedula]AKV73360.1 glutamine amidotransferase [Metallosphaera sedula]AKV75604.1 glutamine amidotransferase [Metallosphaera sedula]AKV77850.1 glutamine amidotransferase [Metallosphaera sedula]